MISTTPAYISTVSADHTITLPTDVPIGTRVAIIIMGPDEIKITEKARHARFQKVLDAIKAAVDSGFTSPTISDEEIDARIERARHTYQS